MTEGFEGDHTSESGEFARKGKARFAKATIFDLPLYRKCREAGGSQKDCKEGAANPSEAWPGA